MRPLTIASQAISFCTFSSLPNTPTSTLLSLDSDMASSAHCHLTQMTELWITYHQASRAHKQVTAQLIDVGDAARFFDLEDVLDHVFEQGFVDPKWRSVVWWEDCTCVRLKACSSVQDLLARGAGSTPETALRIVIGVWFFYFFSHVEWQVDPIIKTQWMSPWPSGCTTNMYTVDTLTPRPSASASICRTSSVSAWLTSRIISLPRDISHARRAPSFPGNASAVRMSKNA